MNRTWVEGDVAEGNKPVWFLRFVFAHRNPTRNPSLPLIVPAAGAGRPQRFPFTHSRGVPTFTVAHRSAGALYLPSHAGAPRGSCARSLLAGLVNAGAVGQLGVDRAENEPARPPSPARSLHRLRKIGRCSSS